MRGQLKHRRLIVTLCLALFQVQLFAASTLGCLHDSDAALSGGCPFHVSVAADGAQVAAAAAATDTATAMPADAGLLDCPKCALNLGLHFAASVPVVTIGSTTSHAQAQSLPALHFYCFTPKQTKKPPIAVAS
ncbi:MAG: hypothetical protein WBM40_15305 [Thiohalocapsa sp.]